MMALFLNATKNITKVITFIDYTARKILSSTRIKSLTNSKLQVFTRSNFVSLMRKNFIFIQLNLLIHY